MTELTHAGKQYRVFERAEWKGETLTAHLKDGWRPAPCTQPLTSATSGDA